MRLIRRALIIVLALLIGAQIATDLYLKSQKRNDPPVISCPQEVLEVSVDEPKSVYLTGMTATDPQDGDVTDRIIIGNISRLVSECTAKVTFYVFDTDHNMDVCTRLIRYIDYHRPRFAILEPLVCDPAEKVSLSACLAATDVLDGDISDRINFSILAKTEDPEVSFVTVHVANSLGDMASLELPVLIQSHDPLRPTIALTDYLVYVEKGQQVNPASYIQTVRSAEGEVDPAQVQIQGVIDTEKTGTYYVFYAYTSGDSVGMAALTVVVL